MDKEYQVKGKGGQESEITRRLRGVMCQLGGNQYQNKCSAYQSNHRTTVFTIQGKKNVCTTINTIFRVVYGQRTDFCYSTRLAHGRGDEKKC